MASETRAPAQDGARRNGRRAGASGRDRRDEIVQIAGRLFAERGFLATTIRDIADDANILSGSLYHHFASKESIADELLRAYWDELLALYDAASKEDLGPTETLRKMIGASISMLDRHQYAVRMILNDWNYLSTVLPYLESNLQQIQKLWVAQLKRGIASGEFDDSLDPVVTYRTVMSSISGTGRWFVPGGKLSTTALADHVTRLYLDGVLAHRS